MAPTRSPTTTPSRPPTASPTPSPSFSPRVLPSPVPTFAPTPVPAALANFVTLDAFVVQREDGTTLDFDAPMPHLLFDEEVVLNLTFDAQQPIMTNISIYLCRGAAACGEVVDSGAEDEAFALAAGSTQYSLAYNVPSASNGTADDYRFVALVTPDVGMRRRLEDGSSGMVNLTSTDPSVFYTGVFELIFFPTSSPTPKPQHPTAIETPTQPPTLRSILTPSVAPTPTPLPSVSPTPADSPSLSGVPSKAPTSVSPSAGPSATFSPTSPPTVTAVPSSTPLPSQSPAPSTASPTLGIERLTGSQLLSVSENAAMVESEDDCLTVLCILMLIAAAVVASALRERRKMTRALRYQFKHRPEVAAFLYFCVVDAAVDGLFVCFRKADGRLTFFFVGMGVIAFRSTLGLGAIQNLVRPRNRARLDTKAMREGRCVYGSVLMLTATLNPWMLVLLPWQESLTVECMSGFGDQGYFYWSVGLTVVTEVAEMVTKIAYLSKYDSTDLAAVFGALTNFCVIVFALEALDRARHSLRRRRCYVPDKVRGIEDPLAVLGVEEFDDTWATLSTRGRRALDSDGLSELSNEVPTDDLKEVERTRRHHGDPYADDDGEKQRCRISFDGGSLARGVWIRPTYFADATGERITYHPRRPTYVADAWHDYVFAPADEFVAAQVSPSDVSTMGIHVLDDAVDDKESQHNGLCFVTPWGDDSSQDLTPRSQARPHSERLEGRRPGETGTAIEVLGFGDVSVGDSRSSS